MFTDVLITPSSESHAGDQAVRRRTQFATGACLLVMLLQALSYSVLGTGREGMRVSQFLTLCLYLIAIASAWFAARQARGTPRLFWLLFLATEFVLLVPSVTHALDICCGLTLVSNVTWRALYQLYGAPVLMMLILPDSDHGGRTASETFLDLLQVALLVGLAFSILFYLPLQQMLPSDALEHNLTVSNLVSLFLLLAFCVRLRFVCTPAAQDRLLRLGVFLLACAVVTFIGNWIDQHQYRAASAWWDLGWDLPVIAASLGAISWQPSPQPQISASPPGFVALIGKKLVLVAALSAVHLIVDRWSAPHESVLTDFAIFASLVALALRLALTQNAQLKEITQRKAAQGQLTEANNRVSVLLEEAHRQTAEITKVNELVSLLQACTSETAAYNLASECLHRLFPQGSGCLAHVNPSKDRVVSMAQWGPNPPADQAFRPNECWALRRGGVYSCSGGPSATRCSRLRGEGPSVCTPLVANGRAIGTLAIQEREVLSAPDEGQSSTAESEALHRRRDLIVAVGQHVALALANLELREALRCEAVRDPLTGLYNRRYMQEFLDRETIRASRKQRPLSVLALDLDNFKSFNDNFGHAVGDHALKLVGEFLLRSIRSDDVACRQGGEEFIIILPECSLEQAMGRAEQIRSGLQVCHLQNHGLEQHSITVSIGVAAFDETTDRVDRLLACADEALYEAKRAGRNRVVAARPVTGHDKLHTDAASSASS